MAFRILSVLCVLSLAACAGSATKGASDYALAVQYFNGNGVEKDQAKAITYLERAVSAQNPDAELAMGYLYLQGTGGVQKDPTKAVEYFVRAAEHGSIDGQYNAGLAFVRGEGAEKDFAAAYGWFEKAAYQGDAGAQYNVAVMSINGEGVAANPQTAYIWFRLANEQGFSGAQEGVDAAKERMSAEELTSSEREYAKVSRKVRKPSGPLAPSDQPF